MLTLFRSKNEYLYIGDNVQVKVLSTSNKKAKLGIKAPDDIPILRGEKVDENGPPPFRKRAKWELKMYAQPSDYETRIAVEADGIPLASLIVNTHITDRNSID